MGKELQDQWQVVRVEQKLCEELKLENVWHCAVSIGNPLGYQSTDEKP